MKRSILDLDPTQYKDEPGTWVGVSRRILADGHGGAFEARYFEIAPGGHTSFERHAHEHVVVVLNGRGSVRLDNEWSDLVAGDLVHVPPETPHQFVNQNEEPFGILCVVDRDRDRPTLLDTEGRSRTSE